jgi:hypothetical protein
VRRAAALLTGALVTAALAGCTAAPEPAVPPPPAAAAAPPAAAAPDADACAGHAATAGTVRSIAAAAAEQPLLPASVALFLLDARATAQRPVADPALAAARAEVVAAIDDLAAQGTAGLPPGGNPARDAVRLDTARLVAAVEAVERLCAGRG